MEAARSPSRFLSKLLASRNSMERRRLHSHSALRARAQLHLPVSSEMAIWHSLTPLAPPARWRLRASRGPANFPFLSELRALHRSVSPAQGACRSDFRSLDQI